MPLTPPSTKASTRRAVLKWALEPTDDIQYIGTGPVVLVAVQNGVLCIWTEEPQGRVAQDRAIRVHGTGHLYPPTEVHLGSALMPPFVWHVFEVGEEAMWREGQT